MTEFHPIQTHEFEPYRRNGHSLPTDVTLRAYEVYKHLFGEQKAMITDHCRGGFCVSEIVAFLYARSFPKEEWRKRVDEALRRPEE